jgi:cell wall-associated NlpC family hydrolase
VNKLLALATTKIGCGYVWGAQGEMITDQKLKWFEDTFGVSHYVFKNVNASKWIGKQAFDCSGLVLWCLQQLGVLANNRDYSAAGFYTELCTPITKTQLVPGDLAFCKNSSGIYHIAIYAGNNKTVEAKSTSYGVVSGTLNSGFNVFGRLKLKVGDTEEVKEIPIGVATVNKISSVLNVRSGPGTGYTDIGDVYSGNVLTVYEIKDGWYRIGVNKWISGMYVTYKRNKDNATLLAEEMLHDGLITDTDYWTKVLKGQIEPDPEYLGIAFKRATDKI